jgi:uncharacterized membrane protein YjjB (DUF3815 family)
MMILKLLSDGFFAAIAGIGFGSISDPPLRAFKIIAILAAIGHMCRYIMMNYCGVDIATASLMGAVLIGFASLWLGKTVYCPMTVLYIPALLPMIPGKFAYNMVFSLIMSLQTLKNPVLFSKYMSTFLSSTLVTCTVVFMLTVGAIIPILLYPNRSFSMTRRNN